MALGSLVTSFVRSSQQIVDIFTKSLAKAAFQNLRLPVGVHALLPFNLKKGEEAENQNKLPITKYDSHHIDTRKSAQI